MLVVGPRWSDNAWQPRSSLRLIDIRMPWLSPLSEYEQDKPYRDLISTGSCSNSNVVAAQVRHHPLIRTNVPLQGT